MNAIQPMKYDPFPAQAAAYCDEYGLDTREQLEKIEHYLRYKAFREAIEPFLKLRADMMRFKLPKMIIHSDGRLETIYEWTEEEKKHQAQIDELIADAARRVGLSDSATLRQTHTDSRG